MSELREPIISLLGHVDHGKTTLLDRIAGTVRAAKEAGGITQHIGAIEVPGATIRAVCEGILTQDQLQVPGLLFIDTPGHRSFETMRRRGGALADIVVLVVDVREGLMPQTRESLQILRHEKTPFAVALTKIDLVAGWRRPAGPARLGEQLAAASAEFTKALDLRLYSVAEELNAMGFSAERYDRVSDFTRNVGIVPVSAKSGVGVPELLALLVGLSQRFLQADLRDVAGTGEGTILERSEQRGIGPVTNVIVYRGRIAVGDEILVTGREEPFATRIRGLYRPAAPRTGKAPKHPRLDGLESVVAAAGVYLAAPGIEGAVPGGIFKVVRSPEETETVRKELTQESHPVAEIAESGVAIHADTLGGLEALAFECKQAQIPVHEASVGAVGRSTVLKIQSVRDPLHRAILAFNVPILPDALAPGETPEVQIFRDDVIYRVVEGYTQWKEARKRQLDARRRLELVHPAKLEILPGFVFRSSKPAIVGIKVLGGTLRAGVRLMRDDGTEVGVLKSLQQEGTSVPQAATGTELAASIEGAVVGRNVSEGDRLLVALPESVARALRKLELDDAEKAILDEIIRLHQAESPFWGQ
ncbi:MAG: translation initiation factor IF-2 [Thermoplasmatales archaeon]|nr:translation initiation factor IF-2 [Thermoplasmatales archaeon]